MNKVDLLKTIEKLDVKNITFTTKDGNEWSYYISDQAVLPNPIRNSIDDYSLKESLVIEPSGLGHYSETPSNKGTLKFGDNSSKLLPDYVTKDDTLNMKAGGYTHCKKKTKGGKKND